MSCIRLWLEGVAPILLVACLALPAAGQQLQEFSYEQAAIER